jgi:DNA ligase-1
MNNFEGKSVTEYHIRYNSLRKMVENKACVQVQVDLIETRFYNLRRSNGPLLRYSKRGLEGTIIKAANAGWKDGKPTYQIKMKLEMDIDLRIVGFNYGSKGTRMSL